MDHTKPPLVGAFIWTVLTCIDTSSAALPAFAWSLSRSNALHTRHSAGDCGGCTNGDRGGGVGGAAAAATGERGSARGNAKEKSLAPVCLAASGETSKVRGVAVAAAGDKSSTYFNVPDLSISDKSCMTRFCGSIFG